MIESNLSEANLSGAGLERSDLRKANLSGAELKGVVLKGAKYDKKTKWPDGFDPAADGAILIEDFGV